MIICPICHKESKEDSKFCIFCGANIKEITVETKRCKNCGASLKADMKFCMICGTKSEDEQTAKSEQNQGQITFIEENKPAEDLTNSEESKDIKEEKKEEEKEEKQEESAKKEEDKPPLVNQIAPELVQDLIKPQSQNTAPICNKPSKDAVPKKKKKTGKIIGQFFFGTVMLGIGLFIGYMLGKKGTDITTWFQTEKTGISLTPVPPTPGIPTLKPLEPLQPEKQASKAPTPTETVTPTPTPMLAELRPKGSVNLGKYKQVEVITKKAVVTEEEIQEEIQKYLEHYRSYTPVNDREDVQEGDTIIVDYTTMKPGKDIEEIVTDVEFKVNKDAVDYEFSKQLIGAEIGQTREVKITYPKKYEEEQLAGNTVIYYATVKVIYIVEEPDLTDEFLSTNTSFTTADELYDHFSQKIYDDKKAIIDQEKQEMVLKKVLEDSSVSDLSEEELQICINQYQKHYQEMAKAANMSLEQYIQENYQMTMEEYEEELSIKAEEQIKQELVLYAIIDAENIVLKEKQYWQKGVKIAYEYGFTGIEQMEQSVGGKEYLYRQILFDEAKQVIYDSMVEQYEENATPTNIPSKSEDSNKESEDPEDLKNKGR